MTSNDDDGSVDEYRGEIETTYDIPNDVWWHIYAAIGLRSFLGAHQPEIAGKYAAQLADTMIAEKHCREAAKGEG